MTDQHLNDETLSALLDDEESPTAETHLATCATCVRRLEELRAVSGWISQPPEPPDERTVDRAVARAVALAHPLQPGTAHGSSARRRIALGAVAAAVAAAVAVSVPMLSHNDPTKEQASSSDSVAPPAAATASESVGVVDGGFLELDATSDLRGPVQAALTPVPVDRRYAGEPAGGATSESLSKAPVPDRDAVPAAGGGAAATGGGSAADNPTNSERLSLAIAEAHARCEPLVRRDDPRLEAMRYRANATFAGQNAIVEVFVLANPHARAATARLDLRAYVLAPLDCRILSVQSFDL